MKTEVDRSYYIPLYDNHIKLLDHCGSISNLDAFEYSMLLDNDIMLIIRLKDNKLNEIYIKYTNSKCMKLFSVREDGTCNTYEYLPDLKIARDDGVIYDVVIDEDGVKLSRNSDDRVYIQGFADINELPDLLYIIAYYLNKNYSYFVNIKNNDKASNTDVDDIKKLIELVNSDRDNTTIVNNLKLNQKIMYWC